MHSKFSFTASANTLDVRYHCNESHKNLPAALVMNGNVCIEQLHSNLDLFFHPREVTHFRQIANTERANEFLMGRFAAKNALALLSEKKSCISGTGDYHRICIDRGTFMQPILLTNGNASLDISITHKRKMVAAIAFPKSHPIGIDLEKIEQSSQQTLESQMTEAELLAVTCSGQDYLSSLWQLWVVKEAVSKVLKTGLTTSFLLFETCTHRFNNRGEISCYFSNFYQYHAQSWILDDHVLAVVHPRTATFGIDTKSYQQLPPSENLQ